MADITQKVKNFIDKAKNEGLRFPMVQDPKTKEPSVTITMVVASFGLMGFCTIITTLLALNKMVNIFTPGESAMNALKEAFSMSLQMSGVSLGAYLGRKFQGGAKPELSAATEEAPQVSRQPKV